MQSKLQAHNRYDQVLEKLFIISINNNTKFVDKEYNLLQSIDHAVGIHQVYTHGYLKTFKKNYIVIHDMGTIDYIENYFLNSYERKSCNNKGLYIFLTEQILHTHIPEQKIMLDGDRNLPNISIDWQQSQHDKIWSPELSSINEFVKNNQLTNVFVCISAEDKHGIYAGKYNFNILRNDAYVNAIATFLDKNKSPTQFFSSDKIDTHFWCGNWGYRPHRHIVTAFASSLDTLYSWGYTDSKLNLANHLWFDPKKFKYKKELLQSLKQLQPNSIDIDTGQTEITGTLFDVMLRPESEYEGPDLKNYSSKELFSNTFCSIINSSTFGEPFAVYDEKPLNAIINFRPFILVGPAGSLELMKKDGFKTFSDFWNESYDNEYNHQTRLEKIFDLLLEIDSWSIEKCKQMHKDMYNILIHNYNRIGKDLHEMRSTL